MSIPGRYYRHPTYAEVNVGHMSDPEEESEPEPVVVGSVTIDVPSGKLLKDVDVDEAELSKNKAPRVRELLFVACSILAGLFLVCAVVGTIGYKNKKDDADRFIRTTCEVSEYSILVNRCQRAGDCSGDDRFTQDNCLDEYYNCYTQQWKLTYALEDGSIVTSSVNGEENTETPTPNDYYVGTTTKCHYDSDNTNDVRYEYPDTTDWKMVMWIGWVGLGVTSLGSLVLYLSERNAKEMDMP